MKYLGHWWLRNCISKITEESKFHKVILVCCSFVLFCFVFPSKDFLSQQGLLILKQNHNNGTQSFLIPDPLEEGQSLLQAVSQLVLPDECIVTTADNHEGDGTHILAALDPFAAVITLATHVLHMEVGFVYP